MNYGWRFVTLYRRQESRPSPRKEMQKKQNACQEALQIAGKRREVKSKVKKKRKINPFEHRVPKKSKEKKKTFLRNQFKEIEENSRMGRTRDLFKKIGDMKGTSSVQFSHSVVSDSLRLHELQHARPPCPSPTPGVHSDSRPWSQ